MHGYCSISAFRIPLATDDFTFDCPEMLSLPNLWRQINQRFPHTALEGRTS